jgi:hypothetical protein
MTDHSQRGPQHGPPKPFPKCALIWLCIAFAAALIGAVAAQAFVSIKGHFGIDGSFGFNAWYGFATCVAMVLIAKLLGFLLKRPDTYYDD